MCFGCGFGRDFPPHLVHPSPFPRFLPSVVKVQWGALLLLSFSEFI
jgi:hypothetical protein